MAAVIGTVIVLFQTRRRRRLDTNAFHLMQVLPLSNVITVAMVTLDVLQKMNRNKFGEQLRHN